MKTISWKNIWHGICFGVLGMMLLSVAMVARAGESDMSWQAPYTFCNGQPMGTPSNIRVLWGKMDTNQALLPGDATTHRITGLTPGQWWFVATALVADPSNPTVQLESQVGGPVFKTVLPAEFRTTAPDVYAVVKRTDRLVLSRVGTVPLGTMCNPAESINGKYVVPRTAVTWAGSVRPDIVVATCQ